MATTDITIKIDEKLNSDLQELLSNLGMDTDTFFTITAKQAVREQALPFVPRMGGFESKSYSLPKENPVFSVSEKTANASDDELVEETGWDDLYRQLERETK